MKSEHNHLSIYRGRDISDTNTKKNLELVKRRRGDIEDRAEIEEKWA